MVIQQQFSWLPTISYNSRNSLSLPLLFAISSVGTEYEFTCTRRIGVYLFRRVLRSVRLSVERRVRHETISRR